MGMFWYLVTILFTSTVYKIHMIYVHIINPLSTNPTKWSNTLKQFVGKKPTNCLSVFDHFVGLALKGLNFDSLKPLLITKRAKETFFSDNRRNNIKKTCNMLAHGRFATCKTGLILI